MKSPKTGRAGRMRAWMADRPRPFTFGALCTALGVGRGRERERTRTCLRDFERRDEVLKTASGKYRYNTEFRHRYRKPLRGKVIKAMYVSISGFTAADIVCLAEAPDSSYVRRIIRQLVGSGHVRIDAEVRSPGKVERKYSLVNRTRFRMEVMT